MNSMQNPINFSEATDSVQDSNPDKIPKNQDKQPNKKGMANNSKKQISKKVNSQKKSAGFYVQLKKAKKLKLIIEPFTEDQITILLDENQTKIDEFIKQISEKLHEKNTALMNKLIKQIGRQQTVFFYKNTVQVQENGGIRNEQFKGFKTPGGVFIHLIKQDQQKEGDSIVAIIKDNKKFIDQRQQMNKKLNYLQIN
ncbi:UNKNOWN [Stylonychia lemnae]|uniref:Phosphorylated adapter RNA export protein n=1 Tax=Stylonychia lemnae TaxID=5949 RepID=A0A078AQI3_STYLE|nr:UNKNOWN [Stylonychia lemnae]|eukprot:CDW84206.1 UNKNOWN [Stylonychia lemnae]